MRGKESPKADTRERLKERRGIAGAGARMRGEGEALAQVTAVTGKGKEEKARVGALVESVTGGMEPGAPAQTERRKNTGRMMVTSAVKWNTEKGAEAEAERGKKRDSVGDGCEQKRLLSEYL